MDLYEIMKSIEKALGDKRMCEYGLNFKKFGGHWVLLGTVDTFESLKRVNDIVSTMSGSVENEVHTLEEKIPKLAEWAVCISSVCDIRREAKFRSERIHQLIFGECAKTLDFKNEYVLIKDHRTSFVGWARASQFTFTDKVSIHKWKTSKSEVVVDERFSKSYFDGDVVYLPFGTKVPAIEKENFWESVIPNGHTLRIPRQDASYVSEKNFEDLKGVWSNFLGTPYLWGGASAYGYDCSGYVGRLYDYIGIKIPRDADLQRNATTEIKENELNFGDLIFFPGHVAMYVGNGEIVHSNLTQSGVARLQLLSPTNSYEKWLKEHVMKFGRVNNGR